MLVVVTNHGVSDFSAIGGGEVLLEESISTCPGTFYHYIGNYLTKEIKVSRDYATLEAS